MGDLYNRLSATTTMGEKLIFCYTVHIKHNPDKNRIKQHKGRPAKCETSFVKYFVKKTYGRLCMHSICYTYRGLYVLTSCGTSCSTVHTICPKSAAKVQIFVQMFQQTGGI